MSEQIAYEWQGKTYDLINPTSVVIIRPGTMLLRTHGTADGEVYKIANPRVLISLEGVLAGDFSRLSTVDTVHIKRSNSMFAEAEYYFENHVYLAHCLIMQEVETEVRSK